MSRKHKHDHEHGEENQEKRQLDRIEQKLDKDIALDKQILAGQGSKAAKSLEVTQHGGLMGVITGIKPGATETFDLSTLPIGSLLQAGSVPSYTQDNTTDVSAVSVAADGMSFAVTGAATFAAGAVLNVTANAVSLDGTKLQQAFNIPLLAAAGVPATGLDLNQRGAAPPAAASFRRL